MKVFKKVLLIFSIVVLVLSLGLNVCLFLSNTNRLILKDDDDLRLKLYYNSYYNLEENPGYTLKYESTTVQAGKTTKSTNQISCHEILEEGTSTYNCALIGSVYEDGQLIRTSYFPGDGYKYTVQGETKTKESYSNEQLYSVFSSWKSSVSDYFLFYLVEDIDNEAVTNEINISGDFDFSSLSLIKTVDVISASNSENIINVKYIFDGKDRVTFVHYKDAVNPETKYEISYKKTIFDFPSFDSFTTNGGNN